MSAPRDSVRTPGLRALTPSLVRAIEHWFDDPETREYLGDRGWIRRELLLIEQMPGQRFRGKGVRGRYGWVALEGDSPVAFLGAELYDDDTASAGVLVAPDARGRGVGRAALRALADRPELKSVTRFEGGVEPQNLASRRCLEAIGAVVDETPDSEGMLRVTFTVPASRT